MDNNKAVIKCNHTDNHKFLEFVWFDLPAILLAANYIFYNALGIDRYKNVIRIAAFFLLLVSWLIKGRKKLSLMQMVFVIIAAIQLILNGSDAVNLVALIGFSVCQSRDFSEDVHTFQKISVLLAFMMLMLVFTGLVSNTTYISSMGRLRSTLGFNNPNTAALFYASALYLWLLGRKKLSFSAFTIYLVITGLIYYFTDCRTMLLASVFYMGLGILTALNENGICIKFGKPVLLLIDLLFLANFLSVFFIDKLFKYDALTSFRITQFHNMIKDAGTIGFLFGGSTVNVDSFYYMLLFKYGVFAYLLFAFAAHVRIKKLIYERNYRYISLLAVLFVYGIMESSLLRPELLPMLLAWKLIVSVQPQKNSDIEITKV